MYFNFGTLCNKISNYFFISINRFLFEMDYDYFLFNDNLSLDNIQVLFLIKKKNKSYYAD